MACYHPVPAYQAGPGAKLVLHPRIGFESLYVACGSCIGCRSARATQWAHRCVHEASLFSHNCFVTLTYDDEHMPPWGWVRSDHMALFLKRLRKRASVRDSGVFVSDPCKGIRFFGSGEYGELSGRPHYHIMLFNCGFTDALPVRKKLFASATLSELWPDGDATIGTCTGASANYIAKYSLKDSGRRACDEDGVWMPPPFLRMSLKPGIGAYWLKKYASDLRHGYLVNSGRKSGVPLAYKRRLKREPVLDCDGKLVDLRADPISDEVEYASYVAAKAARGDKASPARLADAEVIHRSRALSARSL